jgi:hypothetical protein
MKVHHIMKIHHMMNLHKNLNNFESEFILINQLIVKNNTLKYKD